MENKSEFTPDSFHLNTEQKRQVELILDAHGVDRTKATLITLYETGDMSADELRQNWGDDGIDIRDVYSEDELEEREYLREDLIDEEFINQDSE